MSGFDIRTGDRVIANSSSAAEISAIFDDGIASGASGPLAADHAAGAREFVMTRGGEEMRVVTLDADMRPGTSSLSTLADAEVDFSESLRAASSEQSYEDWLDDTGLDGSFAGGPDLPGTSEIYSAALRRALCEEAGILPAASPAP